MGLIQLNMLYVVPKVAVTEGGPVFFKNYMVSHTMLQTYKLQSAFPVCTY